MGTKTRVANKVIWGLEDILALCDDARGELREALGRGEELMDAVLLVSLARLGDRLIEIERKARDARNGEYEQKRET